MLSLRVSEPAFPAFCLLLVFAVISAPALLRAQEFRASVTVPAFLKWSEPM